MFLHKIQYFYIKYFIYCQHYGYECELQGDWKPIDYIMKACSDISPRTVKTAEDMKRIVCDEIDKQDTGNVVI